MTRRSLYSYLLCSCFGFISSYSAIAGSANAGPFPLGRVPDDLLLEAMEYLQPKELAALAINRDFRALAAESRRLSSFGVSLEEQPTVFWQEWQPKGIHSGIQASFNDFDTMLPHL